MSQYIARYGVMRSLALFNAGRHDAYNRGDLVVAKTERGLEIAEVLREADDAVAAEFDGGKRGFIQRLLSDDDQREVSHIQAKEPEEFNVARQTAEELDLDMRLVDVEHVFGGERVVVYYLAEHRVDFREMVRRLAEAFRTRVEMRQIGVRDEAKLMADYGDCGKPVCCNTHLSAMPPVSMKMAKIQKSTLDPTKISGRCGRLKCCLRYEYDQYVEMQKELPPLGAEVITNKGRARVLAHEILAQQLLIETEDRRRVLIEAAEVLTVLKKQRRGGKPRDEKKERRETPNTEDGERPRGNGGE